MIYELKNKHLSKKSIVIKQTKKKKISMWSIENFKEIL